MSTLTTHFIQFHYLTKAANISPPAVHLFFSNQKFSQKPLDFAKTFNQVEKNHLTLLVLSLLGRFFQ